MWSLPAWPSGLAPIVAWRRTKSCSACWIPDSGRITANSSPADAARNVRRCGSPHGRVRRLGEHRVAGKVADTVVHDLEVVEVEDDEGEPAVVAVRAGALAGKRLVEVPPVVEPGERIEVCELARLPELPGVLDCGGRPVGQLLELADVIVPEPPRPVARVDGEGSRSGCRCPRAGRRGPSGSARPRRPGRARSGTRPRSPGPAIRPAVR